MNGDPHSRDERSNADLVHEVLRSAVEPLAFDEIFARVNATQPVRTRNPMATVRGALSQGTQLVSLGNGRYGYLPRLIEGSVVRLPLDTTEPAQHPLVYPDEVRQVLWPSFFEIQKRKLDRPVRMRLPGGDEAHLPLEFLGGVTWGSRLPVELARYLVSERATHSDALILQIVDGEAGVCDARIDRICERDELAVARRDRELADAAREFLQHTRSLVVPIWELVVGLLARGAYRAFVPPHPLEDVLTRDNRFVDSGLGAWMLASKRDSATQLDVRERHQLEAELAGMFAPTGLPTIVAPPTLEDVLRRLTGRPGPPAVRRTRPVGRRRHAKRPTIHQLKVTLKGARPPIWRRLLVRSDITLDRLHEILQTSFGWFDYHLHAFVADGLEYGATDVELDWPVGDERTVTLADVAPAKQCRVLYRYDFGDDWEHDVLVEDVIEPEAGAMYPQCIKGKRASPPEDVGGVWGYAEFLEIMADPAHPEHEERLEWAGGEFDPEEFDLAAVNEALQVLSAAWG